ncbi:MAG: PpiC-type peptidyl-prolyl cis-trans isomerase [Myxococcales bacterium]|nr:PpiC-type peptidyl-prolyl cis-trans isomerase [Myxococcales bacterium]
MNLRTLVVVFALSSGLVGSARGARVVERVVAVINDDIVLETELEQYAAPMYRGPDPETAEGKKAWEETKRHALDGLIDGKLVQQQASELKLTVTPDEVDRAVTQVKEQNKLDDAAFTEALKTQGFTLEGYRKTLKKQILEMKVVNTAVRSRVQVSDEEVKTYYKQNEKLTASDKQSHLRQILIAVPDRGNEADLVKKRAVATKVAELSRNGTKFEELAKQYSDDDGTKASGGDLGWVGKGVLVEALDDAMAAMEPGDVRGPIRTERGFVILQLVERKSGDLRPYEEIKDQLRKQLYDQQVEKAQQSWLRELRKRAHVDIRY